MKRAAGLVLVLAFSVLWLGCAGDSSSSSSTSTPTPTLLSISPSNAQPGGSDFTITATGTNFIPASGGDCGSEICFNHSLRETTFVNSTQLTATIPASLIAQGGTVPVFIVSNCEVTSNTLTFNIGSCSPVVTERASVGGASGTQATGLSAGPAMSSDGRYVTFESDAPDLVTGDGNLLDDIFLRDTCRGATGCTPSTIRVSVDTGGGDPDGGSTDQYMSDDGRFVVFRSEATDLIATDGNGLADIFLRDTCIGATSCTPSTIRVSVDTGGGDPDSESGDPVVSSTGRFVVFRSDASDLIAADTNFGRDIFLRDTCIGATSCTPSTIRVSVDSAGGESALFSISDEPYISGTGRFVAFQSDADDLVTGDGNFTTDAFVRDTCIGATSCTPSTIRASVNTASVEGNSFSEEPQISDDGRFVVFGSFASNLVTGDVDTLGNESDIFVRDTCVGAISCTSSTVMVSVSSGGTFGNLTSFSPKISATGRFVVFDSEANNLVTGDGNGQFDIFVRDICAGVTGCTASTIRVSVNSSSVEGNGFSNDPFITDSGQLVAFNSESDNLVTGDTNLLGDVFIAPTCF